MTNYVTAVLLICATMMGQIQPAQLPARLLRQQVQLELGLPNVAQPQRRSQLKLLAQVDLHTVIQAAAHTFQQQSPESLPKPAPKSRLPRPKLSLPQFLPTSVLQLRGP